MKMKIRKMAWLGFLSPSLIGVILFILLPFVNVAGRSFTTTVTGEFAGLENYKSIMTNSVFLLAVKNTVLFTVFCIPILVVLGFVIALPLSQAAHVQLIKTLYLFPLAMPSACIVIVWKMLFFRQGFVNQILTVCVGQIGLTDHTVSVDFLGTSAAFFVLAGTYIWKNIGYTVVLWLSGIAALPGCMQEAAKVDGAGKLKSILYIMLPNLRGTLYTIVILSFLNSFKIFREAYLVAGSYPDDSIYLLQHLFNNWFVNLELDKMSAAAVLTGIFLFGVILVLQKVKDR